MGVEPESAAGGYESCAATAGWLCNLGGKNKDYHLKFEIKFKADDVNAVLNLEHDSTG